jgi:hypothetical protein
MVISIIACGSALEAEEAKDILLRQGFSEDQISIEQANALIYDAQRFGGGKADAVYDKIAVIGRK